VQIARRSFGVLVVGPGEQGAHICTLLSARGISARTCADMTEACAKVREGADVIVVLEQALRRGALEPSCVLDEEATGGELPIIVLIDGQTGERTAPVPQSGLRESSSVTLLQWPGPDWALVSTVKAALRARQGQCDCRDLRREQHVTAERLRYLESALSLAQEAGRVGVFEWNPVTRQGSCTKNLAEMLGLTQASQNDYEQWAQNVLPDDLPRLEALLADWEAAEGDEKQFEYRYRLGCEVRRIAARARLIRDAQGKPLRVVGTHVDITERKRAEQALRASEEFLRRMLESSADCIKVLDLQGRLLSMNTTGQTLMEIEDLNPYIGRPFADFFSPEAVRAAASKAVTAAAAGGIGKFQAYCPSIHGTPRWWDELVTPIRGPDGRPERLLAISRDITRHKRAEEALRESEEKFRVLAEASRVMIAIVRDRRFLYVNPFLAESSGYTREELLSIDIAELIHPDYRAAVLDRAQRRLAGESMPASYEYLMLTKSGQSRWVEIAPVRIDYRGAPAIIGTAVDITDWKTAAEASRQSEERFRAFFERATVGAAQVDMNGRFAVINDRMCQITGFSREELVRLSPRDITHPDDRDLDWEEYLRMRRGEIPRYKGQKRYVRKDGEIIWVEVTAGLMHDAAGRPVGTAGIIQDITQRKQAEAEVQHQAEGLRVLSETATRLLMANDPRAELPGILEQVAAHLGADVYVCYLVTEDRRRLKLHCSRGLDEESRSALEVVEFGQTVCATAAQTGQRIVINDMQAEDSPKTALLRSMGVQAYACYPLVGEQVLGVISMAARRRACFPPEDLGVVRAVADQVVMALIRERLNAELKRRAEELDAANRAKDHFLAVLSHELRTPLTPVLAMASMLASDSRLSADLRDDMEVIRRNTQMEARLIDDLLDMTRIARGQVELDRRPVELQSILKRAVEVCRPEIETHHLSLELNLAGPFVVYADTTRLEQVFWNLLNNAIKFSPTGGRLAIRCRPEDGDAVTEIVDNGVGIEAEALQRIFNAFEQAEQSHRRQFGGLGLGLAISKALVEMHGGKITAASEGKGRGATFIVRLPVAARAASGVPPPAADAGARREAGAAMERGLRILLVEDHADTVKILTWLLKSAGHLVETAGDIRTALERIGHEEFDLLISDLGLPDGSGVDLMRELRLRGYKLPGIALTGYGQQEDVQRTRQVGFDRHLTKPIELEQLERAIAHAASGLAVHVPG
jgi:PAS domain S-box-containing protein